MRGLHLLRANNSRILGWQRVREYLREATGGTITFEATFFTPEMQVLAFGATQKTREITYTNDAGAQVTENVSSVVYASDDDAPYVGFAVYSPDVINHEKKWSAIFVACAKFSPPNTTRQTRDNSIAFQTPTTTGRFLPDDTTGHVIQETAICDSELAAKAWCEACFVQAQTPGG